MRQANVVLQIITEFCAEYRTAIDGNSGDLSLNELSGGARISFVFHELFSNGIKSLDPFDQVKDSDIRTILYNSSGSSPALFVGTTAFEVIIKQQIKRLEEPSLKCAALIYDELVRILTQLLAKNVRRSLIRTSLICSHRSSVIRSLRSASSRSSSRSTSARWSRRTSSSLISCRA